MMFFGLKRRFPITEPPEGYFKNCLIVDLKERIDAINRFPNYRFIQFQESLTVYREVLEALENSSWEPITDGTIQKLNQIYSRRKKK